MGSEMCIRDRLYAYRGPTATAYYHTSHVRHGARLRLLGPSRIDFKDRFDIELNNIKRLKSDGLVELKSNGLSVAVLGRLLVQNIARVFDVYPMAEEKRLPKP